MDRQNEDPAGTNRGAENDNQDRNNGHTHSSGNGSAQDQPKGATGYNWRQFVYTSKQLRTMVFPPITFIVPGLIPSVGVTLICAKPKIGKSWRRHMLVSDNTRRRTLSGIGGRTASDAGPPHKTAAIR